MTAKRIITIDGPAGSGKSSAAERLAKRLHGICLNSGSFYRIVANELIFAGVTTGETSTIDPNDEAAVMQCVTDIAIEAENGVACRIGGRQIPEGGLRLQLVDDIVSAVSRHQALRAYVNDQLRAYAEAVDCDVVCEGRDAGHIIFPDADFKIYLFALNAVRARRLNRTEAEIKERDLSDMTTKGTGNLITTREARRQGYFVVDGSRPMADVDEELHTIASGFVGNDV